MAIRKYVKPIRDQAMAVKVVAISVLWSLAGFAYAVDIYRWVDERGRTHMSGSVPDRYWAGATKIDSGQFDVSESDRAAAVRRAANDRERLAKEQNDRHARDEEQFRAGLPQVPASGPNSAANRPAPDRDESECDRLWREYFESQICFAPYQFRGGIKVEAYQVCKPVLSPSHQCGPARRTPK